MGEKEAIILGAKIKWVGVIDLAVFYKKLQEWLKIKKYDMVEKKYVEKIRPNGKQIEIVWESKRKDLDYFNLVITTKFFMTGVSEAEIEKEGKRLKLNKIDAELEIDSDVVKDPENKWENKPYVRNIYEKYIIKEKIDEAKKECYKNTYDLIEEIKNYFSLYSLK